jgi:hypothetical protein|tara:strand:- start:108 stop:458 length:351 start_codon:yes stop_codon:yes gene_type:complete
MKKLSLMFLSVFLAFGIYSFSSSKKSNPAVLKPVKVESIESIDFYIKGTGSKGVFVTIGIGPRPGSGSCCSGVSVNSTMGFRGNLGDVVYDGKKKTIIARITRDLEGKTINLKDYY